MERQLSIKEKKQTAANWFRQLRDDICAEFEAIEREFITVKKSGQQTASALSTASCDLQEQITEANNTFSAENSGGNIKFTRTPWQRNDGGGGEMSLMKGCVFEKVGVNISTVHGQFSEAMQREIPGADTNPNFWAAGISLVAHMCSPLVPAVHMNTRMIVVGEQEAESGDSASLQRASCDLQEQIAEADYNLWFGGGADLTPMVPDDKDTADFHAAFKHACDAFDAGYYPKFKQWCDDYFYLKHRDEPRGVGGIFYDQLNSGNWQQDFEFTQAVGKAFLDMYPKLVRRHMFKSWTKEQREHQLYKRGRYVEFNLLHDRGTRFGLQTGGNVDAIFMSLPPEVKW